MARRLFHSYLKLFSFKTFVNGKLLQKSEKLESPSDRNGYDSKVKIAP